jgi:hypothetical protein
MNNQVSDAGSGEPQVFFIISVHFGKAVSEKKFFRNRPI